MRIPLLVIALVLFLISRPIWADIKVRGYTVSGSAIPALTQDGIVSGSPISIVLNSVTAQVFLFDGNSTIPNDSIGPVTISGTTGASTLFVVVGNPLLASVSIPEFPDDRIDPLSPDATYAVNFGGLAVSTTTERQMTVFCAQISGNVTGSISVGKLRRLVAGGSISAQVRASDDLVNGSPGSDGDYAVGRIQATSITSTGEVLASIAGPASAAGIYRVQVNSLQGPVNAFDGNIIAIDVAQDISLNAGIGISAKNGIDSIEANSISVSSVLVNNNGSTFGIGRINARTGG